MIPHEIPLIPLILSLLLCASSSPSPSLCPLDLDYVEKIEWDTSSCRSSSSGGGGEEASRNCCQTLTSLYGVAFAHRLKTTSLFRVADLETSSSCLSDFQGRLSRLGLRRDLAAACFAPHRFVNTTDVCAGVQTARDWAALVGESTALDADCSGDLSDLAACDACVVAGFQLQAQLLALDGNISHSTGCFHYTILYAAGIVNEFGPHSAGALSCIFGLPLITSAGGGGGERSIILASAGAGFAAVVITCVIGLLLRRDRQVAASDSSSEAESELSEEDRPLLNWRPKADTRWFTAAEIERATDFFKSRNLIGRGQFGVVYKGKLRDGSLIAVKKVVEIEFDDFVSEVEIISTLRHRNLVPLRGCSVDDDGRKYLIYDYMPNGNLGQHLYPKKGKGGKTKAMSWPERKSVILDVANALLYLHRGVSPPVYHRDIKPTNILLDGQMRARVADFGLARRGPGEEGDSDSHLTTRIAGTHGYLAPEYALYGQLTEKSDVYSFGIVVLEVMCGRKVLDFSSPSFLITDWAWPLVKAGRAAEVLDPCLRSGGYPQMVMERFVIVGILCAHLMVAFRPTMLEVVKMLEGDIELPTVPDRPSFAPFPNGVIELSC